MSVISQCIIFATKNSSWNSNYLYSNCFWLFPATSHTRHTTTNHQNICSLINSLNGKHLMLARIKIKYLKIIVYSWKHFADIFLTLRHDLTFYIHNCEQRGKSGKWVKSFRIEQPKEINFSDKFNCHGNAQFRLQRKSHNFTKLSMLINLLNYLLHSFLWNRYSRTFNNSISIRVDETWKGFFSSPWSSSGIKVEHYEISYLCGLEKMISPLANNASVITLITLSLAFINDQLSGKN